MKILAILFYTISLLTIVTAFLQFNVGMTGLATFNLVLAILDICVARMFEKGAK